MFNFTLVFFLLEMQEGKFSSETFVRLYPAEFGPIIIIITRFILICFVIISGTNLVIDFNSLPIIRFL